MCDHKPGRYDGTKYPEYYTTHELIEQSTMKKELFKLRMGHQREETIYTCYHFKTNCMINGESHMQCSKNAILNKITKLSSCWRCFGSKVQLVFSRK